MGIPESVDQVFMRKLAFGIAIFVALIWYLMSFSMKPIPAIVLEEFEATKMQKIAKEKKRAPASIESIRKTQKDFSHSDVHKKNATRYANDAHSMVIDQESYDPLVSHVNNYNPSSFASTPQTIQSRPTIIAADQKHSPDVLLNDGLSTFSGMNPIPSTALPNSSVVIGPGGGSTTSTGSAGVVNELSCFASTTGGSYNHSISVSLSCDTTSTINYCISSGACCDPESSPMNYTSPILIGLSSENVCLSFIGTSNDGESSQVKTENYIININLPHLQVSQPKTFYQTTELTALTHIASNDFGKSQHQAGVINLKGHDPSPAGLNLSCGDIIDDYSALSSAEHVITPIATAALSVSDEIEVRKSVPKLQYGDNFVTSYLRNSQGALPLDACSTQNFVLRDFDFFVSASIQQSGVTTSFKEFEAGFQSFGFFESTLPARAPAGSDTSQQADQKLKSNLFSWLF